MSGEYVSLMGKSACGGRNVPVLRGGRRVYDPEGVLGPSIIDFVEHYVRSLMTWDILVYFHHNPDTVLDVVGLASQLGRRVEEIESEVEALCENEILQGVGESICYGPHPDMLKEIAAFVHASQNRSQRLVLIALVLHKLTGQSPASG